MPTQASAASNHKEEEPTAASSPHVSLLIAPLEALCTQPLSLPWLQLLHVWATHWLALMARMSPTSRGPLKGTAAACAAPGYCFNTVVFISVYVSGALWSLSLLHGGNLASVCSLSFMGTPTHSSPWASPSRSEKHHLQAGDGGVCAVTTTDHGCGRWQSVL